MNNIRVLIVSSSIDYSTDLICIELENRKIPYFRLNRDQFRLFNISLNIDNLIMQMEIGNKVYTFKNKYGNAIYFRAPVFLRTLNKKCSLDEQVYKSQWNAFIRNLIIFDKVNWINNPVYTYRAENKMYQLAKAAEIGLCIPKTVASNVCQKLIENKKYIVKSIDTAIFNEKDTEMFMYSTVLTGREIMESDLSLAPVFIQEYLGNKVDIRVTYISGKIYPVKILSNKKGIDGDWRRLDKEDLQYIPCRIPKETEQLLCQLMNILKLEFGGIDLIESDNRLYFIEVNPTGEWGWLQTTASIKINRAIVDSLLMEKVKNEIR